MKKNNILTLFLSVTVLGAVVLTSASIMTQAYAQGKRPIDPIEPPDEKLTTQCADVWTYNKDTRMCEQDPQFTDPSCPDGYEYNSNDECQSTETIPSSDSCNSGELVNGECISDATSGGICPEGYSPDFNNEDRCLKQHSIVIQSEPYECPEGSEEISRSGGTNPLVECLITEYTDKTCSQGTYNTETNVCEYQVSNPPVPVCDDGYELVGNDPDTCRSTSTIDEIPPEPYCDTGTYNSSTEKCETKPVKGNR